LTKLLIAVVFSVLLLVPLGAQQVFAGPPLEGLCPDGNAPINGQCIELAQCPSPTVLNLSEEGCIMDALCPDGADLDGAFCVSDPPSCPNDFRLILGNSFEDSFCKLLSGPSCRDGTIPATDFDDFECIGLPIDNCPNDTNPLQTDSDGDGAGDVCDSCPTDSENQCSVSQVIGGEIIPIEQTTLLLTGTQSFSWMIPVLLSGIGIGLFVVSTKSE